MGEIESFGTVYMKDADGKLLHNSDGRKIIMKNDDGTPVHGRKISIKKNKKIFFYPQDYLKMESLMSYEERFTSRILIMTGARIMEASHITFNDLDLIRCNINLTKTKTKAVKGETRGDPRNIAASKLLIDMILEWKKKKKLKDDAFLGIKNKTLVGRYLKKYASQCEVKDAKDFSAHNLRKTFGTWMLSLNVDGFKVAQHLGHDPNMLRTHYASPDVFVESDKKLMIDILGDLPLRLGGHL